MTTQASGSASLSYVLSSQAYAIPILHAAKNLSHTVAGVFLGRSDASTPHSILVQNAVPLIHTYTSLSPMLEAALDLVETYAAEQELRIIGCYEIREEVDGFSRVGERLLRILRQKSDETFGMTLDNGRLGESKWPYTICIPPKSSDAVLKSLPGNPIPSSFTLSDAGLPFKTVSLIRSGKIHQHLVDFDDQLEDASVDWPGNRTTTGALSNLA